MRNEKKVAVRQLKEFKKIVNQKKNYQKRKRKVKKEKKKKNENEKIKKRK